MSHNANRLRGKIGWVIWMDTTIRKIDPEVYRKFKAAAALRDVTMGTAVTEAMKMWISRKNNGEKGGER